MLNVALICCLGDSKKGSLMAADTVILNDVYPTNRIHDSDLINIKMMSVNLSKAVLVNAPKPDLY